MDDLIKAISTLKRKTKSIKVPDQLTDNCDSSVSGGDDDGAADLSVDYLDLLELVKNCRKRPYKFKGKAWTNLIVFLQTDKIREVVKLRSSDQIIVGNCIGRALFGYHGGFVTLSQEIMFVIQGRMFNYITEGITDILTPEIDSYPWQMQDYESIVSLILYKLGHRQLVQWKYDRWCDTPHSSIIESIDDYYMYLLSDVVEKFVADTDFTENQLHAILT